MAALHLVTTSPSRERPRGRRRTLLAVIPQHPRFAARCALGIGWVVVAVLTGLGDLPAAALAAVIVGVAGITWMLRQWRSDVGSAFAAGYRCAVLDGMTQSDPPLIPSPGSSRVNLHERQT